MPIRTMAALVALLLALIPAQRADGDASPLDSSAANVQYEVSRAYCMQNKPEYSAYVHVHTSHFRSARTHADMLRSEGKRKSAQYKAGNAAHAPTAPESGELHVAPTERVQPAATVPYANLHPAKPASSPPPASNEGRLTSVPEGTAELPGSIPLGDFTPPDLGAFFDPEGDMGIAIGENWYPIMRDFSALREALGEPLDIVLTESCNHPGHYDKEYVYEFGSVYTHPEGDADIWYELFVYGDGINTSRGITNGSTLDDMLAAYGQEYYPDSAVTYIYTLSGREQDFASPAITFETSDDIVIYFDIFYPIYEN